MMCRDRLDDTGTARGGAAAAVAATATRDKARSKEEGVREGVVVGKKARWQGDVGTMEEREEKVKNPTHRHTHTSTTLALTTRSQGRTDRQTGTDTRAGKT